MKLKGLDKKDKALLDMPVGKVFERVLTAVNVGNGVYDSFMMDFDNCLITVSCYVKEE